MTSLQLLQLCKTLQSGWNVQFDEKAKAAFATSGHQWISFDCPKVITAKLDYVLQQRLGGVFVWAVDNDDVHGTCAIDGKTIIKSPIMKLIMLQLNKGKHSFNY